MAAVERGTTCKTGTAYRYNSNVGTMEQLKMRMLEQWNNFQCECWNNGTTYNANAGTMEPLTMRMLEQWNNLQCECWNNGTTYNVNVGTMKQHTMRILEQWNNLQCECWNNVTTYNANAFQGEGRRIVSGKYGMGRANEAGRDLSDWC